MNKQELRSTDMIIISIMDRHTGEYENMLVTNRPRWARDKAELHSDSLLRIEVFHIGQLGNKLTFHSLEEFENAINL